MPCSFSAALRYEEAAGPIPPHHPRRRRIARRPRPGAIAAPAPSGARAVSGLAKTVCARRLASSEYDGASDPHGRGHAGTREGKDMKSRVLVVDDQEDSRTSMVLLLTALGYE